MILAAVNAIGMVVALSYTLTALAAAVRIRGLLRENWREGIRAVVLPTLSAATLLGLGGCPGWSFCASADRLELSPDNGWFLLVVPSLMVMSGFLAAAWAKWGRKSSHFSTGRGTDADAAAAAGRTGAVGAVSSAGRAVPLPAGRWGLFAQFPALLRGASARQPFPSHSPHLKETEHAR